MEHVLLQGMRVQMARHSQFVPCHMIGLRTCDAKTRRYATGHETGHETGTPGTGYETAPLESKPLKPPMKPPVKPPMKPGP